MPDLRSSRFVRPFTRGGSVFSRLRDQPRTSSTRRHGRSEPDAPLIASSGLFSQTPPTNEPQWAFADGHRRYPAVPAMPGLELLSVAPWAISNTHPSVRPDLGAAGPDDEPGEDDDDDETPANNLVVRNERVEGDPLQSHVGIGNRKEDLNDELQDQLEDELEELQDADFLDIEDSNDEDEDFVVGEWWVDDWQPADLSDDSVSGTNLAHSDDVAQSSELTPWPIETPDDAIDTFELLRSSTFHSGLVVLALDHHRIPFLHVALRGNPVDDLQRALSLFCPSLPNGRIPSGLILGVVRSQHREAPRSVVDSGQAFGEPSIWVDPVESATWRIAAWNLHDEGIRLHDVIVIEPDRWMSLARAAGLIAYDTLHHA
jgi:hypothetical protein